MLTWAQNSESPVLVTLLLAIVFGMDPCAILTNIAAMGYLGKDFGNRSRVFFGGLVYTLGRTLTFGLLGVVLILLLKSGGNIKPVQYFLGEYGEWILIPLMIVVGMLLCLADYLPKLSLSFSVERFARKSKRGYRSAFLLGMLLALGFCPTNAVIFFAMLVPLSVVSVSGYMLPLLFAVITALPVVLSAWLLAFSLDRLNRFYISAKRLVVWVRWGVGLLFVAIGLYLLVEHLSESPKCAHENEISMANVCI